MDHLDPPPRSFLGEAVTPERRWQALRLHMQTWFARWAQAGGGEVHHQEGWMWTYVPRAGGEGALTVSSFDASQFADQVDGILGWYRQRDPLPDVLCWWLAATPPPDLQARLLARGFEQNWQPHWMWLDLRQLRTDQPAPANLAIQVIEEAPAWPVEDLPYYHAENMAPLAILTGARPQYVWHLAAFQEGQVVGRCLLHLTMGEWGVAGIFDMGVVPAARKQGIGTALVVAACALARQMGCRYAVLNATGMGESIYRRAGFQSLAHGYTWFLRRQTLAAPPPALEQVAFVEAVGRGDTAALDQRGASLAENALNAPLPSGLTPLDIAVQCKQPSAAAWLVAHGTRLDLVSAWDLGWKEEAASLLIAYPALVNLQRGPRQPTPLHIAAERGDVAFTRLLLTGRPDLEIKDTQFGATALQWAYHLGRSEIIRLIEQYRAREENR
jgi:GNAT superfamily N-acetyltransferase